MINKATEFEMLRSLHTLWRARRLTRVELIDILKKQHNMKLVAVTKELIEAESLDGRVKYSIK
jgi:hypothetical protein